MQYLQVLAPATLAVLCTTAARTWFISAIIADQISTRLHTMILLAVRRSGNEQATSCGHIQARGCPRNASPTCRCNCTPAHRSGLSSDGCMQCKRSCWDTVNPGHHCHRHSRLRRVLPHVIYQLHVDGPRCAEIGKSAPTQRVCLPLCQCETGAPMLQLRCFAWCAQEILRYYEASQSSRIRGSAALY